MPPNFIIAGAPRSGTTWLCQNLAPNPRIFLTANKEPRFYSVEEGDPPSFGGTGDDAWLSHFVTDGREYEALFSQAAPGQLTGEASSDYLYRSEVAARRIRSAAPDARLIFMLRKPSERAVSNWACQLSHGRETLSFADALAAEPRRIESGWAWWWHYTAQGFYARRLEPFFELFPRNQLLILLYDELQRDGPGLLRKVSGFLGVEPVIPKEVRYRANHSSVVRSGAHGTVRRLVKNRSIARVLLPTPIRAQLGSAVDRVTLEEPRPDDRDLAALDELYEDDVRCLCEMTGLDLSGWLDGAAQRLTHTDTH